MVAVIRTVSLRLARRPAGVESAGKSPATLDTLATLLERTLSPAAPPQRFRDGLRRNLALAIEQKRSHQVLLQQPPDHRRGILVGAVVSSAISVASLIAVLLYHRAHHKTGPAS